MSKIALKHPEPHPIDKHVGTTIRKLRKQLGITQKQVAAPLDITYQQFQKNEGGHSRIGCSRLVQIAHILRVSPSTLLSGSEEFLPGYTPPSEDLLDSYNLPDHLKPLVRPYLSIPDPLIKRLVEELLQAVSAQFEKPR